MVIVSLEELLWLEPVRHILHLDPGSLLITQQFVEAEEVFLEIVGLDDDTHEHVNEQ